MFEKFQTEQKGFGIRATTFIKKGTLLMTESPFAHYIKEDVKKIYCNNCFKKSQLKCCSGCKQSFYCSTNCQKKLWVFHKHECLVLKKYESSEIFSHFTLLVYRTLIKLKSKIDWKKKGFLRPISEMTMSDDQKNRSCVEAVIKNLEILSEDDYSLFSKDISTFDDIRGLVAKVNDNCRLICGEELLHRQGHALYINGSLINHDCDPNCYFANKESVLYVRAVRDIQRGEELTTTYCNVLDCKQIRQSHLDGYGFTCNCNKCSNNIFEEEMLQLKDGETMSAEQVGMMEGIHDKIYTMVMRMEYNKAIKLGSHVIEKYRLADCNVFTVKVLTLMGCSASRLERNGEAEDFFLRSIPFETKYSSDILVAVGLTHLQVATILDIRRKYNKAIKHTKKGVEILSVCLGKDNEKVLDAVNFQVIAELMQGMRLLYGFE